MRYGKASFSGLALALMLAGCAAKPVPVAGSIVCPRIVYYTPAEQRQAAAELDRLGEPSELDQMMQDYHRERLMLEACQGAAP